MQDGMIDRFYISVIPVLLGAGVRLFGELPEALELRLMDTRSYNGIVELRYEKR
jgi:dihydrofolate reductase